MNNWEKAVLASTTITDETELDRDMHLRQRQAQQSQWDKSLTTVKEKNKALKENPTIINKEVLPSWSDIYLDNDTEIDQIRKMLINRNLLDDSLTTVDNIKRLIAKLETVSSQLTSIKGII